MFTAIVYADSIDDFLFNLNAKVVNPVIELAFIVAVAVFLWGMLQFIRKANSPTDREKGQQHMLWGLIGIFIMFGVFGIINLLLTTFGITGVTINSQQQTFSPPCIQDIKIGSDDDGSISPCTTTPATATPNCTTVTPANATACCTGPNASQNASKCAAPNISGD